MKKSTLAALFLATMPLHAGGIIAVLKNSSTIERRDAANGSYKGSISVNNALGGHHRAQREPLQCAQWLLHGLQLSVRIRFLFKNKSAKNPAP